MLILPGGVFFVYSYLFCSTLLTFYSLFFAFFLLLFSFNIAQTSGVVPWEFKFLECCLSFLLKPPLQWQAGETQLDSSPSFNEVLLSCAAHRICFGSLDLFRFLGGSKSKAVKRKFTVNFL